MKGLPIHHNRHICVTAIIKDVELKHAVVDIESLLNIILLSILATIGVSRVRTKKQLIEVSGFKGTSIFIIACINLELTAGQI